MNNKNPFICTLYDTGTLVLGHQDKGQRTQDTGHWDTGTMVMGQRDNCHGTRRHRDIGHRDTGTLGHKDTGTCKRDDGGTLNQMGNKKMLFKALIKMDSTEKLHSRRDLDRIL